MCALALAAVPLASVLDSSPREPQRSATTSCRLWPDSLACSLERCRAFIRQLRPPSPTIGGLPLCAAAPCPAPGAAADPTPWSAGFMIRNPYTGSSSFLRFSSSAAAAAAFASASSLLPASNELAMGFVIHSSRCTAGAAFLPSSSPLDCVAESEALPDALSDAAFFSFPFFSFFSFFAFFLSFSFFSFFFLAFFSFTGTALSSKVTPNMIQQPELTSRQHYKIIQNVVK
mmetsp:Transcript_6731/g.16138  ORF Transcript_6731/g.16138 Transcript_6731/m.16138 type:complete len:230 (-) Transcript_6731:4-693(-)